MRITVLGGSGAWPTAEQACSGYLVQDEGFTLLIDPGYATLPRLLGHVDAATVDAVLISHGHPDHCADLNPLLRARALRGGPPPALDVHALPGAVDAVLALDPPDMMPGAAAVREFTAGQQFGIGPFDVRTWLLPHWVPNAGIRLSSASGTLAYTGDTGPSPDIAVLARGAGALLAEATFPREVPPGAAEFASSARQAGQHAAAAGAGALLLTHLWPGTDPAAALAAAGESYRGPVQVAQPGLALDLG